MRSFRKTGVCVAVGLLAGLLSGCGGASDDGDAAASEPGKAGVSSAPAKESDLSPVAPQPKKGAVCVLVRPKVVEKKVGVKVSKYGDLNLESISGSKRVHDPDVCTYDLSNGDRLIVNRWPNDAQVRSELGADAVVRTQGDRKFYIDSNGFYLVLVGDLFVRVQSVTMQDQSAAAILDYAITQLTS